VDYPWTTQLSSPVYYRASLYVLVNNTLSSYNAETGELNWATANPCSIDIAPSSELQLFVASYGADESGSLDAFLVFANTTTVESGPGFTLCRVSHNNAGERKWAFSLDYDARFEDVSGGGGSLLLTVSVGELDAAHSLVTIAIDAETGDYPGGYLNRDIAADRNNLPAFLPNPLSGCHASVVLQMDGVLQAVCTNDMTSAIWVSNTPCFYKAAADPVTGDVVCVDRFKSVTRINATDGTVVWQAVVAAEFAAAVQGNYLWVVDQSATLWAFAMRDASPSSPLGHQLTGGEVVLVIFVVIFVGSFAAAIGFAYYQRRRRSRRPDSFSKVSSTNFNPAYGSSE
jgi:outer membrane protein assembly factor BamB